MKHFYSLIILFTLSLSAQVDSTTIVLDNVDIAAKKQKKEITVGNGTRKNALLEPCNSDWSMLAKLFPYKDEYNGTPFLKGVEIFTRNRSKSSANFRLHLYIMTPDGLPGEELVPGGVIATADRGRETTKADLKAYNLTMPKEGLIVAFEWLKDDNNLYAYEATGKMEAGKVVMAKAAERALVYAPDIYSNDMPEPISYYYNGYWQKFQMNQWARYEGMWKVPALNITLSN